jgi:hypothetical protein
MGSTQPINQQRDGTPGLCDVVGREGVVCLRAEDIGYRCHECLSLLDVMTKSNRVRFIEVECSS